MPPATPTTPTTSRLIAGCMTGTSIDGIDAALIEVTGRGLGISVRMLTGISKPLGGLASDLRKLADQQPLPARRITELMWGLGELHATVIAELARSAPPGRSIDLACVHGQTVYHGPRRTWQLIQPAPILDRIQAPVVFDLRAADIAAGGQGAPLTPIADWILFRDPRVPRAIVNLGGFCNITLLPAGDTKASLSAVRGRDVCACNQLLDGLARIRLGRKFDEDGAIAATGKVIPAAMSALKQILEQQSAGGRSLGTGDELSSWISATAAQPGADVVRTACEAIGQTIGTAIGRPAGNPSISREVMLAGGGINNRTLVDAIRAASHAGDAAIRVIASDDAGIPASYREAIGFAVLGALCQDRMPITLPEITGCRAPAPISGAWVFPSNPQPPSSR